jgi:hypothetical protein
LIIQFMNSHFRTAPEELDENVIFLQVAVAAGAILAFVGGVLFLWHKVLLGFFFVALSFLIGEIFARFVRPLYLDGQSGDIPAYDTGWIAMMALNVGEYTSALVLFLVDAGFFVLLAAVGFAVAAVVVSRKDKLRGASPSTWGERSALGLPDEQEPQLSVAAMLSIIFAFTVPILGLIFGVIGKRDVEKSSGRRVGLGLAHTSVLLVILDFVFCLTFILIAVSPNPLAGLFA